MPTRTDPSTSPGVRTHSCSEVYFRSSGYTALLRGRGLSAGYSWSFCLGVLRCRRLAYGGDVQRVELVDADLGAGVVAELCNRTVDQLERAPQGVGVADRVQDVRRAHQGAVDQEPARGRRDRALRHQADLAVDLHGLGAGRAQLLDGVEHGVHVDRTRTLGDGEPDAGSGDRHPSGQDAELLGLLLGSL